MQIPRDEEGEPLYDEYICQECSGICSFLHLYPACIWAPLKQDNNSAAGCKEENSLGLQNPTVTYPDKKENGTPVSEMVMNSSTTHSVSEIVSNVEDSLHEDNTEFILSSGKLDEDGQNGASSSKCFLGADINTKSSVLEMKIPMFLSKNWRDLLCQCNTCCDFYARKGVYYLVDKEDSLQEYEKMAKEKREERLQQQEGAAMKFINTLGHVQKIEILNGIADMNNELHSFLVCSVNKHFYVFLPFLFFPHL